MWVCGAFEAVREGDAVGGGDVGFDGGESGLGRRRR